ncbi:MAG: glycoside hydrolase family 95 protein, partial [Planctomycetota bacterium]
MIKHKNIFRIAFLIISCTAVLSNPIIVHAVSSPEQAESTGQLKLWYDKPAEKWTEALPVGNGRLGAMIYGDAIKEHIQFNEDSLWTGFPRDYSNPQGCHYLHQIRELIFEGKQREAEKLARAKFMSIPLRQDRYQPFGDVWIEFEGHEHVTNYRRELSLDQAVVTVRYQAGAAAFEQTVFASYPDQVIVIRLRSNKENLNFTIGQTSPHPDVITRILDNKILTLHGQLKENQTKPSILKFESRLKVLSHNGTVQADGDKLRFKNAGSVTFVLAAATSYKNYQDVSADPAKRCKKVLSGCSKSYGELLKSHLADYQNLFRRVSLDLGVTDAALTQTDKRVLAFGKTDDPQLAALFFQYGRYLLIASSRKGSQPANLQGLWNDLMKPPWESKYTTNINVEMNYWPAEICALSECHEPLFDMLSDCAESGRRTAKNHYNCRGWVLHHNTDLWRGTAPINSSNHGIWPTGGAWLTQHLWYRYEFTLDKKFLA